jgi:hypothetical protein
MPSPGPLARIGLLLSIVCLWATQAVARIVTHDVDNCREKPNGDGAVAVGAQRCMPWRCKSFILSTACLTIGYCQIIEQRALMCQAFVTRPLEGKGCREGLSDLSAYSLCK